MALSRNMKVALVGAGATVAAALIAGGFTLLGGSAGSGGDQENVAIVDGDGNTVFVNPDGDAEEPDVRIVRLDVTNGDPEGESFPLLDISLENRGGVDALIHEARFEEIRTFEFPAPAAPHAEGISWEYDVNLGTSEAQTERLSQTVPAGGVDRFAIRLGTDNPIYPFVGNFLYLFRLSLVVGSDDTEIEIGQVLVRLPQPVDVDAYTSFGLTDEQLADLKDELRELEGALEEKAVVHEDAELAMETIEGL
jgi:hypothetical protein